MSRSFKHLLIGAGLLAALLAGGCASLVTVDVTGGWVGTMTWTTGPLTGATQPVSFDLVQEGKDISGSIVLVGRSTDTYTINITFGRATGRSVEFTASGVNDVVTPSVSVTFDFDGEADDTTMDGTGTAVISGTAYEFTWTATLVTPPPEES